ncbi:Uncharacterised protein [Mycobacteroides abscessus subsp. abscessus]|nr:Uncharacterised protein [Mycobacteroides abscessus subsp. abscessus]
MSSKTGAPWSPAASANAASCADDSIPPGRRIRANAPSAASCNRNAPGHASSAEERVTYSP